MKIVAIIQARMGSTRLPGKTLKKLAGQPAIAHVFDRLSRAKNIDEIWLATTSNPEDDQLAIWAKQSKINCYRGQAEDVLDRYYQTAITAKAEVIIRITGDCPLLDPEIVDQIITEFLKNDYDYISNSQPPSYPDGLDVEVFSATVLGKAWREASLKSEREHVTPYIWKNPKIFRIKNFLYSENLSNFRWTLDTEEDLIFLNKILEAIKNNPPQSKYGNLKDILSIIKQHPDWININSKYKRNEGYDKSLNND